jgi:hypothetical protein
VRGYLVIKDVAAPQNFAVYAISGASTDNAGWTQLALTYVTSSGSFTHGNLCTIEFSRSGDAGMVVGKQTIWIPAGAMVPQASAVGAATGVMSSGGQLNTFPCLDFDQTTRELAGFSVAMPKSWDEGTLSFQPYWTASGGSVAQTVRWGLQGKPLSNDDSLDAASAGSATSDDALIATGDLHIGPESSAFSLTGAAEGDLVYFQIYRDVDNDNLAADARLLGIKLFLTLNANTDA